MIDCAALITTYLRDHVTDRVYPVVPTDQPGGTESAWITLTELPIVTEGNPEADYFHSYDFQLGCYPGEDGPGGQPEAAQLARDARAALLDLPNTTFENAVITAVRFPLHRPVPDTDFKPARFRYILDATVYAHVRS